ncbi:MAG TPA: PQQ-binding-like beta-propeller repeat protein [Fimbriimonas sp.]|nr:PQQ-binding-like beta-propeller repeat protein [Fimbriimonas sp.]
MWLASSLASAQNIAWAKFNPIVADSGTSTSCTIGLTAPAGSSGLKVGVSTSHSFVQIPSTVTVPAGSKQMSFTVPIGTVTSNKWATVAFGDGSRSVNASLEAMARVDLAAVDMNPSSVVCGSSAQGRIRLTNPAKSGGFTLHASSSQPFVQVPAAITVPVGSQDATFAVHTTTVSSLKSATITVASSDMSVHTSLLVAQNPAVKGLALSPASIIGGYILKADVTLNEVAPPGGTTIDLSCDQTSVQLPATVTVARGQSSAEFAITTSQVPSKTSAHISALVHNSGGSVAATLDLLPTGLAISSWPKYLGNIQNTGVGAGWPPIGTDGHVKWALPLANTPYAQASVVIGRDSTLYLGVAGAINPDGTLQGSWPTAATTNVCTNTGAVASDGTVYLVGYCQQCLNACNPDGSVKWVFYPGEFLMSSPTIGPDGVIYVAGTGAIALYAINPDGTVKWTWPSFPPATDKGPFVLSSPAIGADGSIYFFSCDWKFYAIRPNGTGKWAVRNIGIAESTPSIGRDGTIYLGDTDGNLYAFNPSGSTKWVFHIGQGVGFASTSIGSDGTIYVGADDGVFCAIKPDGSKKWTYSTGAPIEAPSAIGTDGTIYFTAMNGNFYAMNSDGTTKWIYSAEASTNSVSSPAIGEDGTVYMILINKLNHAPYLYAFGPTSGNHNP